VPLPRPTYLRFVIAQRDPNSEFAQGIFQAAAALRVSDTLEPYERDQLGDALAWLGIHLHAPTILKIPGTERAISWFKTEAKEPIAHVRTAAHLLHEYGQPVRQFSTTAPGIITYEDDWQIVAYPHRDTWNNL